MDYGCFEATHVTHIDFMGLGLNFNCSMMGGRPVEMMRDVDIFVTKKGFPKGLLQHGQV